MSKRMLGRGEGLVSRTATIPSSKNSERVKSSVPNVWKTSRRTFRSRFAAVHSLPAVLKGGDILGRDIGTITNATLFSSLRLCLAALSVEFGVTQNPSWLEPAFLGGGEQDLRGTGWAAMRCPDKSSRIYTSSLSVVLVFIYSILTLDGLGPS